MTREDCCPLLVESLSPHFSLDLLPLIFQVSTEMSPPQGNKAYFILIKLGSPLPQCLPDSILFFSFTEHPTICSSNFICESAWVLRPLQPQREAPSQGPWGLVCLFPECLSSRGRAGRERSQGREAMGGSPAPCSRVQRRGRSSRAREARQGGGSRSKGEAGAETGRGAGAGTKSSCKLLTLGKAKIKQPRGS